MQVFIAYFPPVDQIDYSYRVVNVNCGTYSEATKTLT